MNGIGCTLLQYRRGPERYKAKPLWNGAKAARFIPDAATSTLQAYYRREIKLA